jgi:hypothetical protein
VPVVLPPPPQAVKAKALNNAINNKNIFVFFITNFLLLFSRLFKNLTIFGYTDKKSNYID